MSNSFDNNDFLKKIAQESIRESVEKNVGKKPIKKQKNNSVAKRNKSSIKEKLQKGSNLINEALHVMQKSFHIKTEKLSSKTIQSHEALYQKYVEAFNKISSELDTANRQEVDSNFSQYRSLKQDETFNFNAIKLHELYFHNIADKASEIALDSVPYMRLSRDFGTFENWQFDFMAACLSSREGWGVCVYEPYKNVYMNIAVDGHTQGLPLGAIPIVVMDMWSHSYYKDYEIDKKSYLVAMMREINWNVVEARMTVAERSNIENVYRIQPIVNNKPEKMLSAAENGNEPPIKNVNQTEEVPQQHNDPREVNSTHPSVPQSSPWGETNQ